MPLTTNQLRCVQYPWRYPDQDIIDTMFVLSNVEEWEQFGQYRFAYLFKIHSVAVARRLQIPPNFEKQIQRLSNTLGMFTPNIDHLGHE